MPTDNNRSQSTNPILSTVRGPYLDKQSGLYRVRYKEEGTNKQRSESFPSYAEAKERLDELISSCPTPTINLKPLKRFKGTASDFRRAICDAALALNETTIDGNTEGVKTLCAYIRGLSELSGAIVSHSDYIKLEDDHRQLVEHLEKIVKGRQELIDNAKTETLLTTPAKTLKGSKEPQAKIQESSTAAEN